MCGAGQPSGSRTLNTFFKAMISTNIRNIPLQFETDESLFSPRGIDRGTLAMLSVINPGTDDYILDLGCGYGVVGVWTAKLAGERNVVMCDSDPKAVEMSERNAALNNLDVEVIRSDGFDGLSMKDFTLILSNPPYHADFSIPKKFIEKGFNHLRIGGKMIMVTKRKEWYKNKFIAIFGGVNMRDIDGYHVFTGIKKTADYAKTGGRKG